MGNAYYYFAASLPLLRFDADPPISIEQFIDDCERLLDPRDYDFLRKILSRKLTDYAFLQRVIHEGKTHIKIGNPVIDDGVEFYRNFHNEMAVFRAERVRKNPNMYIRGERDYNPQLADVMRQAANTSNPLESVRFLDRVRWDHYCELEQGHYFNFEFIIIYGIKLTILERHQRFRTEQGKKIFVDLQQTDPFEKVKIQENT